MSLKRELSLEWVAGNASPREVLAAVERLLPPGFQVMLADIRGESDLHFAIGKLSPSVTKDYSGLTASEAEDLEEETAEERSSRRPTKRKLPKGVTRFDIEPSEARRKSILAALVDQIPYSELHPDYQTSFIRREACEQFAALNWDHPTTSEMRFIEDAVLTVRGSIDSARVSSAFHSDADGNEEDSERDTCNVHILTSYERTGHTLRVDRKPSQFEVGDVVIAGGDCWRVLRKLTKYRGHGCELYVDRISNWQVERALRGVNL